MPAIIVDPALQAEVIRQFNLRGDLSPFNLTENVVPVFDIGKLVSTVVPQEVVTPNSNVSVRVGLDFSDHLVTAPPDFTRNQVTPSVDVAPAGGTVLADSGALAAGDFWLDCNFSHDDGTAVDLSLQWRNAANTATVLELQVWVTLRTQKLFMFREVALNERFRFVNNTAIAGTALSYIAAKASARASIP